MSTHVSNSELAELRSNYEFMQNSPLVRKLNKKVAKLKRNLKILNRVILHLGGNLEPSTNSDVIDLTDDVNIKSIVIKQEPVDEERITYEIAEEDADAFECDDCNVKGRNCYEELGLTKQEALLYICLLYTSPSPRD